MKNKKFMDALILFKYLPKIPSNKYKSLNKPTETPSFPTIYNSELKIC